MANLPALPAFLPRTLRFRVAVLVGLLSLAAGLLSSLVALYPVGSKMKALVGDQEFALLTSAAAALDQDIGAKRTLLRPLSAALAGDVVLDGAGLQRFLEARLVLREEFANVIVFNVAGKIVANLADRREVGVSSRHGANAVAETLRNREGVLSPPYRSRLTGHPIVLVTEPVFDSRGNIKYVLGATVNLWNARFMGQFTAPRPGHTAYFFLLDQQGTIIFHPDRERLLHNVWHEPGGPVPSTRAALEGFEGWKEGVTKKGRPALVAYKRLHRTGWILGTVYPVEEAFAALYEAERTAYLSLFGITALAAGAGLFLTSRFLRPLGRLRQRVQLLTDGQADIDVLDTARNDEIGDLSRAFFRLSQQRQEAEARLALLSRTDVLTGLNNRRMFEAELPAALARAGRTGGNLALAYLDIDEFKRINDTHGHPAGDEVLVEFARRLRGNVREVDVVARLAGDEFVILFGMIGTGAQLTGVMDKLLAAIRQPFHCSVGELAVTASVGGGFGAQPVSAQQLLGVADAALYQAKAAGRDTWALLHAGGMADTPRRAGNGR